MLDLHSNRERLLGLAPMIVRPCKYPKVGLHLELPGLYATFGINPLDVQQYPQLLDLKALVREHLFDSKSARDESLLGQFWAGIKYARPSYRDEYPRVEVTVDFGVRHYSFAGGPQMIKNAGPGSELRDHLIVKVFNVPGCWHIELEEFSKYLQERGLAIPDERNAKAFKPLSLELRLSALLHRVEPGVVLAARRASQVFLDKCDAPELLSWVEKDNLQILEDLALALDAPVGFLASHINAVINDNAQLRSYTEWAGSQRLPSPSSFPEDVSDDSDNIRPMAA